MSSKNPKTPTPKTARRVTDDRDRALYVISVAADLAGVHPQTLRSYERKGLLQPQRTEGRARRYSPRDIEHVQLIQELTQERGMNLAGVEMVMQMTREIEQMKARMDDMRRLVEERERAIRELAEQRRATALIPIRDLDPMGGA